MDGLKITGWKAEQERSQSLNRNEEDEKTSRENVFLNKLAEEDKADMKRKEDINTVKEKRGGDRLRKRPGWGWDTGNVGACEEVTLAPRGSFKIIAVSVSSW